MTVTRRSVGHRFTRSQNSAAALQRQTLIMLSQIAQHKAMRRVELDEKHDDDDLFCTQTVDTSRTTTRKRLRRTSDLSLARRTGGCKKTPTRNYDGDAALEGQDPPHQTVVSGGARLDYMFGNYKKGFCRDGPPGRVVMYTRIEIDANAPTTAYDLARIRVLVQDEHGKGLKLRRFVDTPLFQSIVQVCRRDGLRYDGKGVFVIAARSKEAQTAMRVLYDAVGSAFDEDGTSSTAIREAKRNDDIVMNTWFERMDSTIARKRDEFYSSIARDPTYGGREAQFSAQLSEMARHYSTMVSLGSDGAPNWPDGPLPEGFGIRRGCDR